MNAAEILEVLQLVGEARPYVVTYYNPKAGREFSYFVKAYTAADAVEQARVIAKGYGCDALDVISVQPNQNGQDRTEEHRRKTEA